MKKKHICLVLLLMLILLGCKTISGEVKNPADVLQRPERKDIYFSTGNDYYDLYIGYSNVPGPEIRMLTRKKIDPETIAVTVDTQAEYTVYITEQETGASLSSYEIIEQNGIRELTGTMTSGNDFPLYLYQTYAGIDWAEVESVYTTYQSTLEQEDTDAKQAAYASYANAITQYVDAYSQLKVEDLPRFYEYLIQIIIDDAVVPETLRTVEIRVGDTSYNVEIGEIFIRQAPEGGNGSKWLSMIQSSPYGISSYPYGVGIESCSSAVFYAEESLILTGLRYLENTESTVRTKSMTVLFSEDEDEACGGRGIEIPWDGTTPIYVEQGQYVSLKLIVQDERMKEINYHSKLYPVFQFTCGEEAYEVISEIPLCRYYADRWLLYAIGLDGLDTESYFNDFYYAIVSNWRNTVK